MRRFWVCLLLVACAGLALGADLRWERLVAPGTCHTTLVREAGPWVINVLEVERGEPLVRLVTALAGSRVVGLAALSQMAAQVAAPECSPVALVNGDFFSMDSSDRYQGDPLGLYLEGGELISAPGERASLVVGAGGELAICRGSMEAWVEHPAAGRFPVTGLNQSRSPGALVLYTPRFDLSTRTSATGLEVTLTGLAALAPATDCELTVSGVNQAGNSPLAAGSVVLSGSGPAGDFLARLAVGDRLRCHVLLAGCPAGAQAAIAGGPVLLRAGQPNGDYGAENIRDSLSSPRHPRTAVGFNERKLYLVTVDGRQEASVGMSLSELTGLMRELGCTEALNLDGGGSTEMWVRGRVVNRPSDGKERPVANALGVVNTAPLGPPHHLVLPQGALAALSGHPVALQAEVEDRYYHLLAGEQVSWECPPGLGQVAGNLFTPGRGKGELVARCGEASACLPVAVFQCPYQVRLDPAPARPAPGQAVLFSVRAVGPQGQELATDPGQVRWAATGGTVSNGLFVAGEPGAASVSATVNGVSGVVELVVGEPQYRLLEGFEGAGKWRFVGYPAQAQGRVETTTEAAHEGKQALCLEYDLPAGAVAEAAYARVDLPLGEARCLGLWVWGDGGGLWLRARLRDGRGQTANVDLAPKVDWQGEWKHLEAVVPGGLKPPVRLESLYVVDMHPAGKRGRLLLDQVELAGAAPAARRTTMELPRYLVRRDAGPMRIDGVLDEPTWKAVKPVNLLLADGGGEPQQETEAKLCWDERYLYVAFTAIDTDIWGTLTRRDEPLFEEEVVEIFVSPTGSLQDYYELEVSPRNVIWDGNIHNPNGSREGLQGDATWNCEGLLTGVRVVGTLNQRDDIDQLWSVEMAIPFAAITREGGPPRPGEVWRGNLFRIDRGEGDEFSAWSPTLVRPASFHVPRYFGYLEFSGEKA